MSHTNSTANLSLPQFIGTDKPTWLSDVNGAFAAIDSYAGSNDAALAIVDGKADTAIGDASSAVTTATNAATTAGNAAATATNANTIAGNALTVANGINSKVGVLTDLHTTDKSTVVAAINELADASGVFANAVRYDDVNQVLQYWDGSAWQNIGGITPGSTLNANFIYDMTGGNWKSILAEVSVDGSGAITLSRVISDESFSLSPGNTKTFSDPTYGITSLHAENDDQNMTVVLTASALGTALDINPGSTSDADIIAAYLPVNQNTLSASITGAQRTGSQLIVGIQF